LLRVEADQATFGQGAEEIVRFRQEVEHKMLRVLGLRSIVEIVAPGSLPRTDFKARRVIDDRSVFREMRAQIERTGR
jgi:phenylacetate-CoA ligase